MKKVLIALTVSLFAAAAFAAFDASQLQNATVLAARGRPDVFASKALVTFAAFTTNSSNVSTLQTTADYYGKAQLVIVFSGNADAAYTNDVAIKQGAATATNTVATFGHTGNTRSIQVYELDFTNNVTLAKWAVEYEAVTDNAAAYSVGVHLIYPDGATPATAGKTVHGPAVDKMPFAGTAGIVVSLGSAERGATNFTGTVTIQDSTDGSTGWTNVTGASTAIVGASGGIATIPYDMTRGKRYIRAVLNTTNDVGAASIIINSYK